MNSRSSTPTESVVRRWLTPPEIARQLGIDPAKVVAWIRRGELTAVNVAEFAGGRPRYRISPEAFQEFLTSRKSLPSQKPSRRRRQSFERKYYV